MVSADEPISKEEYLQAGFSDFQAGKLSRLATIEQVVVLQMMREENATFEQAWAAMRQTRR